MSPRPLLAPLALLLLLLATACGGATTSADTANSPDPASDPTGNETDGTVVVEDVRGEVELPAPAERVVALEWTYVEDLLAVGVQPVGVADIDGYDAYVTAGPRLDEDVVDVGTRQEPSLEAIAALEPDLIVTDRNRAEANLTALEQIAPVLLFDPYDGDQLETMREDFTALATAVGEASRPSRYSTGWTPPSSRPAPTSPPPGSRVRR